MLERCILGESSDWTGGDEADHTCSCGAGRCPADSVRFGREALGAFAPGLARMAPLPGAPFAVAGAPAPMAAGGDAGGLLQGGAEPPLPPGFVYGDGGGGSGSGSGSGSGGENGGSGVAYSFTLPRPLVLGRTYKVCVLARGALGSSFPTECTDLTVVRAQTTNIVPLLLISAAALAFCLYRAGRGAWRRRPQNRVFKVTGFDGVPVLARAVHGVLPALGSLHFACDPGPPRQVARVRFELAKCQQALNVRCPGRWEISRVWALQKKKHTKKLDDLGRRRAGEPLSDDFLFACDDTTHPLGSNSSAHGHGLPTAVLVRAAVPTGRASFSLRAHAAIAARVARFSHPKRGARLARLCGCGGAPPLPDGSAERALCLYEELFTSANRELAWATSRMDAAARPLAHSGGKRAALSRRDALRAAVAALRALEIVHAAGAAHCDVRLESICCIPNRAPPVLPAVAAAAAAPQPPPPREGAGGSRSSAVQPALPAPLAAAVVAPPPPPLPQAEACFFALAPVALQQPGPPPAPESEEEDGDDDDDEEGQPPAAGGAGSLEALQAADIAAVGALLSELLVVKHLHGTNAKAVKAVLKRLLAAPTAVTPSQVGRAAALRKALEECVAPLPLPQRQGAGRQLAPLAPKASGAAVAMAATAPAPSEALVLPSPPGAERLGADDVTPLDPAALRPPLATATSEKQRMLGAALAAATPVPAPHGAGTGAAGRGGVGGATEQLVLEGVEEEEEPALEAPETAVLASATDLTVRSRGDI